MITIALAAAAAMLGGSPAGAQTELPPATQSTRTANEDPKKLICVQEDQVGSRLGRHRTCMTAEQWKEKHREQREWTEEIQSGTYARDSAVDPPPGAHGIDFGPQ
jgi:invasion protein IalB